jgi:hypothetical protein
VKNIRFWPDFKFKTTKTIKLSLSFQIIKNLYKNKLLATELILTNLLKVSIKNKRKLISLLESSKMLTVSPKVINSCQDKPSSWAEFSFMSVKYV